MYFASKLTKFVHTGPIGSKSSLVRVMAWRHTGNKSLPEPMLAQFVDAYVCYLAARPCLMYGIYCRETNWIQSNTVLTRSSILRYNMAAL